jgi:hypothetical protein
MLPILFEVEGMLRIALARQPPELPPANVPRQSVWLDAWVHLRRALRFARCGLHRARRELALSLRLTRQELRLACASLQAPRQWPP